MHSIALILALAASAPLAGDLGALEVRSLPGTEVLWEGISLGTTDGEGRLLIQKIPFGRYEVKLRKEGHVEKSVEVEVAAGAATRLHLTLKKVAPPQPPPRPAIRQEPPQPQPPPEPVPPPAPVLEAVREPAPTLEAVAQPEPDATPTGEEVATAADSEPAPAGDRRGFPVTPTLLVGALLAGGLGLFLARRRPQPVPLRRPAPGRGPAPPDPETISPSDDDPRFIETLRQQEKDLDHSESGSWRREPEIIDAEFIEVLETNEE